MLFLIVQHFIVYSQRVKKITRKIYFTFWCSFKFEMVDSCLITVVPSSIAAYYGIRSPRRTQLAPKSADPTCCRLAKYAAILLTAWKKHCHCHHRRSIDILRSLLGFLLSTHPDISRWAYDRAIPTQFPKLVFLISLTLSENIQSMCLIVNKKLRIIRDFRVNKLLYICFR